MPTDPLARLRTLTFKELDRLTIRTGCESELNRQADLEMHRRGYKLSPGDQMWMKDGKEGFDV